MIAQNIKLYESIYEGDSLIDVNWQNNDKTIEHIYPRAKFFVKCLSESQFFFQDSNNYFYTIANKVVIKKYRRCRMLLIEKL